MVQISGRTRITGLFGYPVEHTLSPAIHNAAFKAIGLDCCYVPFLVHPEHLEEAVKAIRALNLIGVNVTVPYKEKVIPFLDDIHEEASFIGAVNTVVNTGGKLTGYNTDGRGFMQALQERGISTEGKDVLVVGAGGASRAISYYLCRTAKRLYIYGRTKKKAQKLVSDLMKVHDNIMFQEEIRTIDQFQIIINATPLGLRRDDPLPIRPTLLKKDQIVCDLIYKDTQLLEQASKKGCVTLSGMGMLLWQGAFAFELLTGKKPPVKVMRNALVKAST
jgi:shikimate dehydrogenase